MPERLEASDVVSFMSRLAERREAHILTHPNPHLETGEGVKHWIRVRRPGGGREGFAYLTPVRLVVHWLGGQEPFVTDLAGIRAWGLSGGTPGGPVLTIETTGRHIRAQLPAGSEAVTSQVKRFLEAFARSTPGPPHPSVGEIAAITTERMSWGRRSRRIMVTLSGVALTIVGIVLAVPLVPGPGLLVAIGGIALLASEYDWAKDTLNWAQDKSRGSRQRLEARRRRPVE